MPGVTLTALHKASMENDCNYFKNKTITSEDLLATFMGNTPLLWGVASSSVSFVLTLLDSPDTTHVNVKSTTSRYLNTPLILSIAKGYTHVPTEGEENNSQMAIVTKLLQKGAEVNAIDVHGRTALHYACLHRNYEAITALVNAGATWNIKDTNSQTPLDLCCMNYKTASQQLRLATGGSQNYTFTLVNDNFASNDNYYPLLSSLLARDNICIDASFLSQAYAFNQKIDCALAPIYNHAKKLFNQCERNLSFENYMTVISLNNTQFQLTDSIENRKIKSLLITYFELKNFASARIDFSHSETIINTKKNEIEQILHDALNNPELMAERNLITRVGVAVLNLVSVLCLGLPLLANYYITGQVFFSHQTKTETLLNNCKDEMATCTSMIN